MAVKKAAVKPKKSAVKPIKVAIVGLDTSHSVAMPQLMQDPKSEFKVEGMKATRCLRFETPFQGKAGLDQRQKTLEEIGVKVTEDFDEAVGDCDAIMIEINDPSRHLEYFEKCAELGKPIFLDKPYADTLDSARKIADIAEAKGIRYFTASSLRYDIDFQETLAAVKKDGMKIESATTWGPVGHAAAGSSIIWYGVHAFEMLQQIMGCGAVSVSASEDRKGYVCHVAYGDGRRGIVELTYGSYLYGAQLRDDKKQVRLCQVSWRIPFYKMLLDKIVPFFQGGAAPVPLADCFESMALLAAAEKSISTGRPQPVYTR